MQVIWILQGCGCRAELYGHSNYPLSCLRRSTLCSAILTTPQRVKIKYCTNSTSCEYGNNLPTILPVFALISELAQSTCSWLITLDTWATEQGREHSTSGNQSTAAGKMLDIKTETTVIPDSNCEVCVGQNRKVSVERFTTDIDGSWGRELHEDKRL